MQWARRSLLAAGAAGFLSASFAGLGKVLAAEQPIGKIERLVGRVFLQRGDLVVSPRRGTPVFSADELTTEIGAKLQIRLNDGSLLVMGGGSTICLADVALPTQEAPGRGLVMVSSGILRLILRGGGAWEGFAVQSSTSVASVRGTDFVVAGAAQYSEVFVVSGLVEVEGKAGGQTRLAAGQGTSVPIGERPPRAKRWGAARVAETMAQVQITP